MSRWPTAVDLFSGCGGVTEGLKRSRFRVVAAVDNNKKACETYKANHKSVNLYQRDINQVDPLEIYRNDLSLSNLGVLSVCAPCQPFSSQTRKGYDNERVRLILEAVRFARHLKPKYIFFENVPGLRRERFSSLLEELRAKLASLGYSLSTPTVVNAADYSVPQRRLRCIMLASRSGEVPPLPPVITPEGQRSTVRQAIGRLPSLSSGQVYAKDPLHFARTHSPINLERLSFVPKDGGSRRDLPEHLRLPCHHDHQGHPDVYGRMKWDDVSPTLTTGCTDITRGRFAHPEDNRAITLREAARLQTFPDSYKFEGFAKEVAVQIGNAVPVKFVAAIAAHLRGYF